MAVNPNIKKKADDIRNKIYGKEVRESLASGLEEMSSDVVETVGRQDEVESQFQDVIENTTDKDVISAPEIIAARDGEANLKARLDKEHQEVTTQLAQNVKIMKNGDIKLPSDFPSYPFDISKVGKRKFKHNATPYNQYDWSSATEIYITHVVLSSGAGLTPDYPISLGRFKENVDDGIYGEQNDFILNIVDNVYYHSGGTLFVDSNLNLLFRSLSHTGFTWLSGSHRSKNSVNDSLYNWTSESNVYVTTMSETQYCDDIVNYNHVNADGIPYPYIEVSTLAECQNKRGTFYKTGDKLYCNPKENENIQDCLPHFNRLLFSIRGTTGVTMFENIGLYGGAYNFDPSNFSDFYFFDCKMYRGHQDAFSMKGKYNCFVFDTVASYGSKDGFNYHATSSDSLAVEVNCVSYGNGLYKKTGGNTTNHSNNGSTSHDGMFMLRVGGKYSECEGPVVADEDAYAISIGCEAYDIIPSSHQWMVKSGFYGYDSNYNNKRYVIECLVSGDNFEHSISGDNVYYLNMESAHNVATDVVELNEWSDFYE